eukprot:3987652-Prymnesium_polylepis.1
MQRKPEGESTGRSDARAAALSSCAPPGVGSYQVPLSSYPAAKAHYISYYYLPWPAVSTSSVDEQCAAGAARSALALLAPP